MITHEPIWTPRRKKLWTPKKKLWTASPSIQSDYANSGTGSVTGAFPSNNKAKNTIVAVIVGNSTSATDPGNNGVISDTQNNVYTNLGHAFVTFSTVLVQFWVAYGIKAGANSITVTGSLLGDGITLYYVEEPPSGGTRVSNITAQQYTTASTPTVSLAGTVSGDVTVGFGICTSSAPTVTPGSFGTNSAFNLQNPFGNGQLEDGYASGGNINANVTGSDNEWLMCALSMMPPGGANSVFYNTD